MTGLPTLLITTISWVFASGVYAAVESDLYIETALNDTEIAHLVFMGGDTDMNRSETP